MNRNNCLGNGKDLVPPLVECDGVLCRKWGLEDPDCVLVLVHGMGAHSARWMFLAEAMLKNNVASYAIELDGFGMTSGHKGYVDSFTTYFKKIKALAELAASENKGKKIFLAGESMGGLISFSMIKETDLFGGLICISPAFRSGMKMNLGFLTEIMLAAVFDKKKQFEMPFTSAMCTKDVWYQDVMDMERAEHRLATPTLLLEILKYQSMAFSPKHEINVPVLFLLAGSDKLVDVEASEDVYKKMRTKDKEIIEYDGAYHALSIDTCREKVFRDIMGWITRHKKNDADWETCI
ncbi:MAG TPA: alpha/beta fold hydrolase [Candidatus Omnitrophota bacterium]|nr:alpha/beta fold hydrolase [Candidatus Omnitrophota bacterium]HPS19587.1 alpha/beta fold hydrolase [Candidatus Omnitrophota bacterium]